MYYNIAGHIIEIKGEKPGFIPAFSTFVPESCLFVKPLISIVINEDLSDKQARLIYRFTIEKGTCEFLKHEDSYLIRWKETTGILWLMNIQHKDGGFIALSNMNEYTDSHILSFSIWIAFGIASLNKQTVAIHASAVIHKGSSILFLGESGTGKSTQSSLWLKHIPDTELLNDDSPFVGLQKDEIPVVYGSPWSGKTPCYKNKQTPVSAFIRLLQAPHNSIRRLRTLEAIGALQPSLPPIFASEPALARLMLGCLSPILYRIPVYILDCLPDEDAVDLVYSTLKKDGQL